MSEPFDPPRRDDPARDVVWTPRRLSDAIDGGLGRWLRDRAGAGGKSNQPGAVFHLPPHEEEELLASVDLYLQRGLELDAWFSERNPRGFAERFPLARTFDEPDFSYGFFDQATIGGQATPVMGNFQEMFYDRPKSPHRDAQSFAFWVRAQMRQFVLRYFMRVSDFRDPQGFVPPDEAEVPLIVRPFDWCPRDNPTFQGFGFQQLYYKRARSGEIGEFPAEERFAIVDLRELGPVYEWIVVKVCIFDFKFVVQPFGSGTPQLVIPLEEDSYLVINRDFITDAERPERGVLGRYGFGYAFIKSPRRGLLAYGPGEFDAAFERIDFEVREGGTTRVAMAFGANRPNQIVDLRFDPVGLGLRLADTFSLGLATTLFEPVVTAIGRLPAPRFSFDPVFAYVDAANLLTGGAAGEQLCISRQQLDKDFLLKHFMQHYQTISGSLSTWREVADWLDTEALPEWAIHGRVF